MPWPKAEVRKAPHQGLAQRKTSWSKPWPKPWGLVVKRRAGAEEPPRAAATAEKPPRAAATAEPDAQRALAAGRAESAGRRGARAVARRGVARGLLIDLATVTDGRTAREVACVRCGRALSRLYTPTSARRRRDPTKRLSTIERRRDLALDRRSNAFCRITRLYTLAVEGGTTPDNVILNQRPNPRYGQCTLFVCILNTYCVSLRVSKGYTLHRTPTVCVGVKR